MTSELFISGAAGQIENSQSGLCQTMNIERKILFNLVFFFLFLALIYFTLTVR